ncbi:MAG: arsenate reductase (glutaredoxin) [Crocinitomicaceae bacterium]
MKIYHNNNCSKSNCSLDLLKDSNVKFETIEYLENPLSHQEISDILVKLNIPAEELIRKGEPIFKEHFMGKTLTESEWIDAMVKYPILIQRPIIVKGNSAVIGRPIEKVIELIQY